MPETQPLLEGQGVQAAEEAQLSSPEEVAAREASQTEYEGSSEVEQEAVVGKVFPDFVGDRAAGPPQLEAGERATGFPADDAMSVDLGEGRTGLIVSASPMAVESAAGGRVPLNFELAETESAFAPKVGTVGLVIPKHLADGPGLRDGVSLTAVDAQGNALGGAEGAQDGAVVLYSGVGTDEDVLVKPSVLGFSEDAVLFSERSDQTLYYRVGLPAGGQLVQAPGGSGAADVMVGGSVVAEVVAPRAHDATGALVPVSMSVSGDVLKLGVEAAPGAFEFPIEVDPEVVDTKLDLEPGNWFFGTAYPSAFHSSQVCEPECWGHAFEDWSSGNYSAGQYAFDEYQTQGLSHIYAYVGTEELFEPHSIRTSIRIESPGKGKEGSEVVLAKTTKSEEDKGTTVCPSSCTPEAVTSENKHNAVIIEDYAEEGGGWEFSRWLRKAEVKIEQEAKPVVAYDTADKTISGKPNANYYLGVKQWVNSATAVVGANPSDPGIGVSEVAIKAPGTPSWGHALQPVSGCEGAQCDECWNWVSKCAAGESSSGEPWTYGLSGLPEGKDTIEMTVGNATGSTVHQEEYVQVDNLAPHGITLHGMPSENKLGDGVYRVYAEATDGSGSTESSGVASIALSIDGREVGAASGSCSRGPCTATSSTWTIAGSEYGAGQHTLTLTATDKAGNVATEAITFTVQHATPVPVGPGSVNPVTGEMDMAANDVSVSGGTAQLTVSRGYDSRNLSAGARGPLGGQWSMSVGGQEELVRAPNGALTLLGASGGQTTFAPDGKGGFLSPAGDANLTLSEVEKEKVKEYLLKDTTADTTSRFTLPSGGGEVWTPAIQEGPIATNTLSYAYQTVEVGGQKVTEPTEALAPVPSGVSCSPKLERGCRALTFSYATSTTATGENQSQWGEYQGRLVKIAFTAWDPTKKEMITRTVAEYSYDKQGRLRAEWNPQVSPALKTFYGYDGEGHLTALTAPGQETWTLHYGTLASDPANTGRLLSAAHPSKPRGLSWSGEAPVNTAAPTLSTSSPVEGATISIAGNGTWNNSPVSYTYQWENCWASFCHPIAGATNSSFTPNSSYTNQKLKVLVTATNAGGSVIAASAETSAIKGITPTYLGAIGKGTLTKTTSESALYAGTVADAVDSSGNIWVADSGASSSKVYVFSPSGSLLHSYPVEGVATGIAINQSTGEVYVGDAKAGAIRELSSTGASLGKITLHHLGASEEEPTWIALAVDAAGNIWSTDYTGGYAEEFNNKGEWHSAIQVEKTVGLENQRPIGIATDGEHVYVSMKKTGGGGAQEYTYSGTLFKELEFATIGVGFAFEPDNGFLYTDKGTSVYEYWPTNIAKQTEETCSGNCESFAISQFGSEKLGEALDVAVDSASHDLYVADHSKSEIEQWSAPKPEYGPPAPPSAEGNSIWTVDYQVPVSGTGAPNALGASETEKWGQGDNPVEGTAVFPPDEPMGWPAKDYKRATVYYRDSAGRTVNVAAPNGGIATSEYNSTNDVVRTLSPDNRAAALAEGSGSKEASQNLDTEITYNAEGNQMLSSLGPRHTIKLASGTEAKARQHTTYSYNEGAPAEGGPYNLPTKIVEAAKLASGEEVELRTTSTSYSGQENLGWKLRKATSVTTAPSGLKLTHTTIYDPASGNVTETRMPASPGAGSPHDTQTIYYSSAANSEYPECGEHREWAGLACQTQPAAQPKGSLPPLAISTDTYNIFDEPETQVSTSGSSRRTTTMSYDAAGRPLSKEASSTTGTAIPKVTYEYNSSSGALEKQATVVEGKSQTITSSYNTLGQLTAYTDADGNESTYSYDVDGRTEKTSDGKGTQTYTYDPTTGFLTKLLDSAAGTFTATYDAEGNITSEGYPNGMTANYTRDQTAKPIALEYVKTTHCSSGCTWFSDKIVPSIHGQWLSQTSSLSTQSYTYDGAGRLTQVQNTPAGKGCTTRVYKYDADTNRLSLTTREPNSKGECTSEGGTTENHTYDEADRLTDTGTSYDAFSDITALPAGDAGGSELTSTYYTDGQLASQTQNGQTIGYQLDPAGRTRENVLTGKTNTTIVDHYAGPGDTPAWTTNTAGEWTRNITGISGTLVATQSNSETPVLELTNLHDDIIATAYLSETATGLASTADTSEYGVPTTSLPPKYSWLGAIQVPTELPSGAIAMGARSYIPQLGRFLQPDPRPGGSANAYSYTFGDPVNTSDPTGEYTAQAENWMYESSGAISTKAAETRAAEIAAEEARKRAEIEAALRIEAEWAAEYAAWQAHLAGPSWGQPEEWEEWWWEEEGEYEEAAYHSGAGGQLKGHVEGGVLYQPLGGQDVGESTALLGSAVPLCGAGVEGPCADDAMRFQRALCAGAAIFAASCNQGDEKYRTVREEPPVQRSSYGREAEKAGEDGEEGEETVEILCIIFCP